MACIWLVAMATESQGWIVERWRRENHEGLAVHGCKVDRVGRLGWLPGFG